MTVASEFEARPLTPAIGAEIVGLDLRRPLAPDTVAALRRVWLDRGVVFFRDQMISPEDHLRFARAFGEVKIAIFENKSTEIPGFTVIDQSQPKGSGTDRWHADSTFLEAPPMGAILRAEKVPACGGDTLWASMTAAYEALDVDLQKRLDGLFAEHSGRKVMALVAKLDNAYARESNVAPPVVHPVVRIHPETGKKLLFVSDNWVDRILELSPRESNELLHFLYEHVKSPELQCRFRWERGSIAFWDNRATQHYAVPDYQERRVMHRVMLAGDVPFGPSARSHASIAHPSDANATPPTSASSRLTPP